MENINTNLGVCVTKVKMLRPKSNPKNKKIWVWTWIGELITGREMVMF